MILDKLDNKNQYIGLGTNFEKAFRFLAENKLEELPDGKYELDGAEVYVLVQSYVTKPESEAPWEAHRKYIDIQYIASGRERIGWAPVDQLQTSIPYAEEKDIVFFGETKEWAALPLTAGYFAVLFPQDAHKPCCIYGEASKVKKIVIKIKI